MSINEEVLVLLDEKRLLEQELDKLIYGSIEIRDNKYIYTHYRDEGVSITKYAGEYSDDLCNLINNNNIKAKEYKKRIRTINNRLNQFQVFDSLKEFKYSYNVDFAKSNIINMIYDQSIIENINTTYIDTEDLIENGRIHNMNQESVLKITNLKRAWDFILNEYILTLSTSYELISNVNKLVESGFYYNAGILRSTPVRITGTKWLPTIPNKENIRDDIDKMINSNKVKVDIAIDLLLYICKSQMFLDGNKRTALIIANHYLISHGKGLLMISADDSNKYKELLLNYYEKNDKKELIKFLKEDCYIKL
ncbi:MAG: Fic family protein [Bacilli bacterium]|nr:Fic family protein [Bacilli bacterium]